MHGDIIAQSLGSEVFTAMSVKSSNFWGIMPCSFLNVSRRFGEHVASIFRV
jgi:hypothetical protein